MTYPAPFRCPLPNLRRAWQHRLVCAVMAMGMGFPGAAYPLGIDQLLRMPLEQLLQLRITPPSAASDCMATACTQPARGAP